jgi:hypothetical protein
MKCRDVCSFRETDIITRRSMSISKKQDGWRASWTAQSDRSGAAAYRAIHQMLEGGAIFKDPLRAGPAKLDRGLASALA